MGFIGMSALGDFEKYPKSAEQIVVLKCEEEDIKLAGD